MIDHAQIQDLKQWQMKSTVTSSDTNLSVKRVTGLM